MNTFQLTRKSVSVLVACAVVVLLLAACQPAVVSPNPTPEPTTASLPTQPAAASTPAVTAEPAQEASGEIVLDLSGAAQGQTVETVAATPAGSDAPYWEIMPQHQRITLQGYPVTDHLMQPQIFVYPVADLAQVNEAAGQAVADLQALLESQQPADRMPFLPLFNAAQVMHAQPRFLDFQNGRGLRYLTQFDQAPLPINNAELIYTFQGLTDDGQTYVAAVLPVTHPDLPASAQPAADLNDFAAYLAQTVAWLEQQPSGSFTPDLAQLDALIQSIEVQWAATTSTTGGASTTPMARTISTPTASSTRSSTLRRARTWSSSAWATRPTLTCNGRW